MQTVKDVSRRSGVSVRTLHHYHQIGLLPPTDITAAGHRLYDEAALARLWQILLYKELGFSLQRIKHMLSDEEMSISQALEEQIEWIKMKKMQIESLLEFALRMKESEVYVMDFSAFDQTQLDIYAEKAKEKWGETEAYKEFSEKTRYKGDAEMNILGQGLMDVFKGFSPLLAAAPDGPAAQAVVGVLQAYITEHFYTCTPEILRGLGELYVADATYRANIDAAAGAGVAAYAGEAIRHFCNEAAEV